MRKCWRLLFVYTENAFSRISTEDKQSGSDKEKTVKRKETKVIGFLFLE